MLSKFASAVGPPWKGAVESPAKLFWDEAVGPVDKSVVREDKPNLLKKN